MRSYGKIELGFWRNPKIRRLSEKSTLFMVYLFSCPHGNSIGAFVVPVQYIMHDLRWTQETVSEVFQETLSEGLIEYDETTSLLRIVAWFEHNTIDNPNVGKEAIKYFKSLPDCEIKYNLFRVLETLPKPFMKPLIEPLQGWAEKGLVNGPFAYKPKPEPNLNLVGRKEGNNPEAASAKPAPLGFDTIPLPASAPPGWLEEFIKIKGWNEPSAQACWEKFAEKYVGQTHTLSAWKLKWCQWWSKEHEFNKPKKSNRIIL